MLVHDMLNGKGRVGGAKVWPVLVAAWLTHGDGPVAGCVGGIPGLEDWSD